MMKVFSAAIVLLAGLVATASAGERGATISKSNLSGFGFASMTQMSDNDGLAVRGMGTKASAWGSGSATYNSPNGTATSSNGYRASSQNKRGDSLAAGANVSLAGEAWSGRHGKTNFIVIGAAGGSVAYAK